MTQPESVLGRLAPEQVSIDPDLAIAGQEYVDFLQKIAPRDGGPKDLPTYAMREIRFGDAITLDCGMGTYFGALRTCDVLEWEILAFVAEAQRGAKSVEPLLNALKCRMRVHSLSAQPVMQPTGRSAAVAVSTVVVFRRADDYGVILQRRSAAGVAVHGDLWHVAPSFMFQPIAGDTAREYSVVHNIYREYLEELFRVKEASQAPSVISHDYFYGNRNLIFLRSLLDRGDASLLFTGVAVNLLNLRPEICTVLHISSPDWFSKHSRGIDGVDRLELNEEFLGDRLCVRPIEQVRKGDPAPEDTVPPGSAALCLALTSLRKQRLPISA
ncbi:hypothetical protein [Paraburkholderia sp. SIMBA_030]|uniref:hypothetical protein n=1 Tax=Paraburkholderia sp. SIMBA_030 TaxID=3085773 RepID=UPI00397844AB